MTTKAHGNLTESDGLHQPKGVNTATIGQVYVADGNASGSWQSKFGNYTLTTAIKNLNSDVINVSMTDIGTAGAIYVVAPRAGNITKIYSVVDVAPATTDTIITPSIGGVNVTSGNLTISFSGSAVGDVDSSSPSGARTVTAGQAIKLTTDGGCSNVVPAHFTIVIDVT